MTFILILSRCLFNILLVPFTKQNVKRLKNNNTFISLVFYFALLTDLGEYEPLVWNLRFVSALLGSLVVPVVYEVGVKQYSVLYCF